jgi:OOP family OmpA-OmpF porin
MAGVTGQIKLSDRIALTGDFTTIPTQNKMLQCLRKSYWFQDLVEFFFNGTVGVTVY